MKKEIKDGYITPIGINGNNQLSKRQRSMMPYRSRIVQPGIFLKEKLLGEGSSYDMPDSGSTSSLE